jgi:heme/copper-type cytochrome/quinol oxidase subunit 2
MEFLFYSIVFFLMAFALVATILVGVSRKNREGNPSYDQKNGKNIIRLIIFYVIAIVGGYALFAYYMYR